MFWLLVNVVLKFLDVATTYVILSHGGSEMNPLVRWVMARIGVAPGLFLVFAFVCALLFYIRSTNRNYSPVFKCLAAVQACVVIWNFYNLLKIPLTLFMRYAIM